jgi:hypothetical protein
MRSRTWKHKWGMMKPKVWKENNIYSTSKYMIRNFKAIKRWRRNIKWMSSMDMRRIRNRSGYMNGDMNRFCSKK